MNLAELKVGLRGFNINSLRLLSIKGITQQSDEVVTFRGLNDLKNTIEYLKQFPIFYKEIGEVLKSPIYETENDEFYAVNSKILEVRIPIRELIKKIEIIYDILDDLVPEEDENAIRIKLPPAKDFDDLSKVMNDLKRAISIPIHDERIGGEITIERAEPGSIWLLVLLRSKMAVQVVSELCWSAMVLMKQYKSNQFVNEQIREYRIENDMKEVLLNSQKKLLDQLVQTEASNIQNNYYENQQHDQTERLVLSIKTIHELFLKGAEIKPSLNASPEIIKNFPMGKEVMMIESRVKQISQVSEGLESEENKQPKS